MRKLFFLVLILSALMPVLAYAHGDKYLEFDPDNASYLKVSDVEIPSQIFFAQNDFLGGFDVFVANPGSSGTATFSLMNELGDIIANKTVAIPAIAVTSGGTRLHVDISPQLAVLADKKYSIRISSLMPDLLLYYSNRIKLVSYNAPFMSPYITGVGALGGEEQPFSFKYALYEVNETSAPIISNISWTAISPTQMKINFNTNEAVDYRIEYGVGDYSQSTGFLGDHTFCTEGITDCSIVISVSADTNYQYRLTVKDIWNNQSQAFGTFSSGHGQTPVPTVVPGSDTTPPVIMGLQVADASDKSVGIAWTTDEAANSYLVISFSDNNITITNVSDPTLELEHYLQTDSVLNPDTTYNARIITSDSVGNESRASISFRTLRYVPSPTPTPIPSPQPSSQPSQQPSPQLSQTPRASATPSVQPQPSITNLPSSGGSSSIQIAWPAPSVGEPSDGYRIDIFDKEGKIVRTLLIPAGSHQAEIDSLSEGEYKTIIYENNNGVFKKVAQPKTFKAGGETFIQRLLALWPYILLAIGLLIGFVIWQKFKKKTPNITTKVLPP